MRPSGFLPSRRRASVDSMPWSTALRRRWPSGASSRSRMSRSTFLQSRVEALVQTLEPQKRLSKGLQPARLDERFSGEPKQPVEDLCRDAQHAVGTGEFGLETGALGPALCV